MPAWLTNASSLYGYTIVISFFAIAVWETIRPRDELRTPTGRRWLSHALLALVYTTLARFLLPATALLTAVAAQASPYGLLNAAILPGWAKFVLAVLILDLTRYAQHWLYHFVAPLWNFHRVHHSDPDYDLTTGLRFHPVEAILSQASYLIVIALIAAPPAAVLTVELASIVQNFFAHANGRLPGRVDRLLRRLLVTPDLHRIHHSDDEQEQGRNLGNLFPWWDRLFGTYQDSPNAGPSMTIGLRGYQNESSNRLQFLLSLPFERFLPARRANP